MTLAVRIIEGSAPGPSLLVTAGVHGDEYEPMAAVRRLAARLDPALLHGRAVLVPVVNEPAFRRASRTAEDGLDLARTCPGRSGGSVTEMIASEISDLIRESDFLIDLHTGGTRYTLGAIAGYMLHPNINLLDTQRRMAKSFGFPLVWGTDPSLQGRTLSVARDAFVPAIYTESGGGGSFNPQRVEPLVQGCLNVMGVLGMLDPPRSTQEPCWLIEDPRPGSGYLQGCHRAPRSGFFDRNGNLKLFDHVRAGEPLGTVHDPLGEAIPVVVEATGLLIGLHTSASVTAGDGLAIVIEMADDAALTVVPSPGEVS